MSVLTQPADTAPLTRAAVAERLQGGKVDIGNAVFKWTMLGALWSSLAILLLLDLLGPRRRPRGPDRPGPRLHHQGNSGDSTTAGMWQAIYGSFFIALFVASSPSPWASPPRSTSRSTPRTAGSPA